LAFERRLKAIETIWGAMLDVLRNTPSIVALTDIFLIEEYPMLLEKTRYRSIIAKLTDDDFKKLADATESAEQRARSRPATSTRFYSYIEPLSVV
jgi:hypothetical protein